GTQPLAERPVGARDSKDGETRDVLASLEQVRSELAAAIHATGPGPQRKSHFEKLSLKEEELSRRLSRGVTGTRLDPKSWQGLDDVRAALPDQAVLVEFVRLGLVDFHAKGTEQKQQPHYAAWVIPARGAVRVVDLGD